MTYAIGTCLTAKASPCEGTGSVRHRADFLFVRAMVGVCSICHFTLAGYSTRPLTTSRSTHGQLPLDLSGLRRLLSVHLGLGKLMTFTNGDGSTIDNHAELSLTDSVVLGGLVLWAMNVDHTLALFMTRQGHGLVSMRGILAW